MSRVIETKAIVYIFTDIIQAKEIELKTLPYRDFKKGKVIRVPQSTGHVKEYFIDNVEVQNNSTQLIMHVKLMPL